jgi:hypothetical protein
MVARMIPYIILMDEGRQQETHDDASNSVRQLEGGGNSRMQGTVSLEELKKKSFENSSPFICFVDWQRKIPIHQRLVTPTFPFDHHVCSQSELPTNSLHW